MNIEDKIDTFTVYFTDSMIDLWKLTKAYILHSDEVIRKFKDLKSRYPHAHQGETIIDAGFMVADQIAYETEKYRRRIRP